MKNKDPFSWSNIVELNEKIFGKIGCDKTGKKMKWNKFSDFKPTGLYIWISNFKKVWLADVNLTWQVVEESLEYVWADAEIAVPEVPLKLQHWCKGNVFSCYEDSENNLFISNKGGFENVRFCPFCGFSLEKKDM